MSITILKYKFKDEFILNLLYISHSVLNFWTFDNFK